MIQEILMWASIIGAFAYTTYSLGKTIWNAFQDKPTGCAGGCPGCSAKTDLLKQVRQNKFKPVHITQQNH